MSDTNQHKLRSGPFDVDLHTHELRKGGSKLRLVGQPFQVLAMLLSRPGELVTREELRSRLWPNDTFGDFNHGLNAAVNKLREALCDSADDPRYVETVPRRGYRFIAEVEPAYKPVQAELGVATLGPLTAQPQETPAGLHSRPDGISARAKRRRLFKYFAAGALVILIGSATLFSSILSRSRETATMPQRTVPLTDLADATTQAAFSPNGEYMAFVRGGYRAGDSGVFVKAVRGDKLTQLTRSTNDCCPVWSPDGQSIAFSRDTNGDIGIYVVPPSGGPQRRLMLNGPSGHKRGYLDWSPDGESLAFDCEGSIVLLSLENSSLRHITEPPPQSEDWAPKFSRNGQKILFVRTRQMGLPEDIMIDSTKEDGAPVTIVSEHDRILGPPQWSADERALVFATDHGGRPTLWKISTEKREPPVEIGQSGWNPSVSRVGYRFAYERMMRNLSVWEMSLQDPGAKHVLVPMISSTDQGPGPQFSSDGKKLAYMSDRSGTMEIWVSDSDGGNPHQVTAVGGAGTPRWSPDSKSITFDAHDAIFVVEADGTAVRPVVKDRSQNLCPSWSRDGKWIYFSSSRSGSTQLWKVPEEGGAPIQLTTRGGHAGLESLDGRYVYYAKTFYANPEIWRVRASGGEEKLVSSLIRPESWASWAVVERGILFAGPSGEGKPILSLFDLSTHRVKTLGTLDVVPFWLGATSDGQTVAFDRPGSLQSQIMLVENFR